jgi:hypothetical protein
MKTLCSTQASLMRWRRFGPMPSTSCNRADSRSMMPKIFSPNLQHSETVLLVMKRDPLD